MGTETKLVRLQRTITEDVVVRVPEDFDVEGAGEDALFQMADTLDAEKHGEHRASPGWYYECPDREVEELEGEESYPHFYAEDNVLDGVAYVKERLL